MTCTPDSTILLELAADCFAAARFCPSEAEIGAEYAALAAAALKSENGNLPNPDLPRRQRQPRRPPPGGLLTSAQAAAKLGCSVKTLAGYVASGALKYVALGHGKRRQHRMFTESDLTEFIQANTRKDSPCLSSVARGRPIGTMTSGAEVIDFAGPRKPGTGAKRKR
jgi:hypothetical protein